MATKKPPPVKEKPKAPSLRIPTKQEIRKEARKRRIAARERFKEARKASKAYERSLISVATQIGNLVKTMAPNGVVENMPVLNAMLRNYAQILRPWAEAVAKKMVEEVAQRDEKSWSSLGTEMGQNIKQQIQKAPVGETYQQLMAEQIELITSLPTEAAERVHRLVTQGLSDSTRASEIAKEILRSGDVAKSRAMTIARTETSRAATAFTQARAQHIGVTQYIWRTAGDADVRETHRHLEGKVIDWNDPPVAGSNGEKAHAGAIYNCRCWPEPILPDVIE